MVTVMQHKDDYGDMYCSCHVHNKSSVHCFTVPHPQNINLSVISVVGHGSANADSQRSMRKTSYGLSIAGIVITVILIIVFVALFFAGAIHLQTQANCYYGSC